MRILHCLESLDPAAGGPARSVPQLALAQAQLGHEVGVWTADSGVRGQGAGVRGPRSEVRGQEEGDRGRVSEVKDQGTEVEGQEADEAPPSSSIQNSKFKIQNLTSLAFAEVFEQFGLPDIVHDHGIWLPFHKEIAAECARRGIPRIVSPRGMLEPWALNHKKWKKRLAWWLYQRRDLHRAAALHATAESEASQLRKLGFRQRIIVAANGVAEVDPEKLKTEKLKEEENAQDHGPLGISDSQIFSVSASNPRTALFLSRIHPKKGLPMLLEAWARLRPDGWQLRIVGPDEGGHVAELKRLCEKLGLEWGEGELSVVSGRLSVGSGELSVVAGQLSVGSEELSVVGGQLSGESACGEASRALKLTDNGQRTTDNLDLSTDGSLASTLTERRYKAEQVTDPFNIQKLVPAKPRAKTDSKFKILFSGPLDGEEKWQAFREADLFVLPTYSENFGIAVAEALACGVPVITTTGAPWAGLLEHQCGWWVEADVAAIGEALKQAIELSDEERRAMGERGAAWVREEFAWEGIARKVVEGYGEILNV